MEFLSKEIYLFSFVICYVSRLYCENYRKFEQDELVENLAQVYLTYRFLQNLQAFSL